MTLPPCPFILPVRIEDGTFLVADDCELISDLPDATQAERDFIVAAINSTASAPSVDTERGARMTPAQLLHLSRLIEEYRVAEVEQAESVFSSNTLEDRLLIEDRAAVARRRLDEYLASLVTP